ncbi:MAG: cellulase family glycosylhydrolase [Firmicutes bacterium]|nr:cellulase family glycosylhydrolase [Bacillota bacterium]
MLRYFPMAVWYGGGKTRATMIRHPKAGAGDEWQRDLRRIKDCGFNTVKIWVDWAASEPAPGEYCYEAQDLIMEIARELGLRVIIQLYLDSAPDWLFNFYPDSRYISAGGDAIDSQGSPGYCYDHPGIKTKAEAFMQDAAKHFRDREELIGWDLWSEPHIVQWAYFDYLPQPAVFCYCHYTVQRFRDWLKAKYGSIEALNTAWYRTFSSWDVVDAPRFISLMTYTDAFDWQEFIMHKLAEDLRWRAETVRQVDPLHIMASHSDIPCLMTLPRSNQGAPDDWRMAKVVDIWGTSFYPKHVGARETNDPSLRSAELAQIRSSCTAAGKPYWLGELQGGHGYVGMFAAEATAQDELEWTWQPISHGAKGLCFYAWHPMNRGYESAGFGMANLDGSPSERAKVAGAASKIVTANMDLFFEAEPVPAEAAILYNVNSNVMWTNMRERSSYVPSRSLLGAYRALFEENIPADYLHIEEIEKGRLSDYKALYMPFSLTFTEEAANQVRDFVRSGGTVIAEARTAWNDETGVCGEVIPGFGLSEVFGCREVGVYSRPQIHEAKEEDIIPITLKIAPNWLPGLEPGDELAGYGVRQTLEATSDSAVVIAEFADGRPAIVANRYEKGMAILIGTFFSFTAEALRYRTNLDFLKAVARAAGVVSPIRVEPSGHNGKIEARLLRTESGLGEPSLVFVFNHYPDVQEITITAKLGQAGPSAGEDTGKGGNPDEDVDARTDDDTHECKDARGGARSCGDGQGRLYDLNAECEVPAEWGEGYVRFTRHLEGGGVWVGKITTK